MKLIAGSREDTWQPVMTTQTNTLSYWLNWRVLVCAIWVVLPLILGAVLIWKYEGADDTEDDSGETQPRRAGTLYEEECWKPCLKEIHPVWLLAYRVVAFLSLLAMLIVNIIVSGGGIFYFYTQWTFTLVTIYFGLGALLSIQGCYQVRKPGTVNHMTPDVGRNTYIAPALEDGMNGWGGTKSPAHHEENYVQRVAGIQGYALQIIFQTSAGASMLTDVVFWTILFPLLTVQDYEMNFLLVAMHTLNIVFLLGDAGLNCLRFPWFRISYFVLWTAAFVSFQWIIHACISLWWPYPFLDLSSPFAPLWARRYSGKFPSERFPMETPLTQDDSQARKGKELQKGSFRYFGVAILCIPCFALFAMIVKLKHYIFSKYFPGSYQSF